MNVPDITPVTLMIEMRERLVRIETKMDASSEKVEAVEVRQDNQEARIVALENDAVRNKTRMAMLAGLGGGFATVASLFGDKLLSLF